MKRIMIVAVSLLLVATLVLGATMVMAAKPQNSGSGKDVIELSNGFPSGPHFNLNIHGKKAEFDCDSTPGGRSVFVDEVGGSTIQYVTNKKSAVTELMVLDPCAIDGGTAKVQLPYEPEGYYVFARILAKPNNNDGEPSNIVLYPNHVVQACNDTDPANPDFPSYTECPNDSLLALGLIVGPNLYIADPGTETYVRFDPGVTKGKGKSKATDITRLFTYTGWVVADILDIAPPYGEITIDDIPLGDYDDDPLTDLNHDYNNDSFEDENDIQDWLTDLSNQATPQAWYFDEVWILNIADLVVTEQGLENEGTKLLQIRFYPVETTEYVAPGYIVVDKVTVPLSEDIYNFTLTGGPDSIYKDFTLNDAKDPYDSGHLKAGSYEVTELSGLWPLTGIEIHDPDGESSFVGNTAYIDLDPGEVVYVIFTNTEPTP